MSDRTFEAATKQVSAMANQAFEVGLFKPGRKSTFVAWRLLRVCGPTVGLDACPGNLLPQFRNQVRPAKATLKSSGAWAPALSCRKTAKS